MLMTALPAFNKTKLDQKRSHVIETDMGVGSTVEDRRVNRRTRPYTFVDNFRLSECLQSSERVSRFQNFPALTDNPRNVAFPVDAAQNQYLRGGEIPNRIGVELLSRMWRRPGAISCGNSGWRWILRLNVIDS
jgi:hypothetical protein